MQAQICKFAIKLNLCVSFLKSILHNAKMEGNQCNKLKTHPISSILYYLLFTTIALIWKKKSTQNGVFQLKETSELVSKWVRAWKLKITNTAQNVKRKHKA